MHFEIATLTVSAVIALLIITVVFSVGSDSSHSKPSLVTAFFLGWIIATVVLFLLLVGLHDMVKYW